MGESTNNKRPQITIENKTDSELYPGAEFENGEKLENLKGKSLNVYYYLVNNPGEHGVREVQRKLNYSSPSVASYHLNRLLEYNLIKKTTNGNYFIEGDPVRIGALADHVRVAGLLVPRILVYGVQALISIIIALLFYFFRALPEFWLSYFVISNTIFIIIIIKDAITISSKLKG